MLNVGALKRVLEGIPDEAELVVNVQNPDTLFKQNLKISGIWNEPKKVILVGWYTE